MKKALPILLLIPFLYSCHEKYGYKYNSATIPSSPVNLEFTNSEYDDYNQSAPGTGDAFTVYFSSNRRSGGGEYDIIYKLIAINFSFSSGEFTVGEDKDANANSEDIDLKNALGKINTSFNELGPYLSRKIYGENERFLMYAHDEVGNFDVKFIHNTMNQEYDSIAPIQYLNSSFDDYYPALNKDSSQIYWCSNRNGQFDIFNVELDNSLSLIGRLYDNSEKTIRSIDVLNSSADDKCPFILEDYMVFASDRPGGFGGFDLYYSEQINGEWSEPKNFGAEINSEYDEYRPIIRSQANDFTNDLMLFSSNRPGGLGGFDLYYVGIDKIN